jgi:hypothetical protein
MELSKTMAGLMGNLTKQAATKAWELEEETAGTYSKAQHYRYTSAYWILHRVNPYKCKLLSLRGVPDSALFLKSLVRTDRTTYFYRSINDCNQSSIREDQDLIDCAYYLLNKTDIASEDYRKFISQKLISTLSLVEKSEETNSLDHALSSMSLSVGYSSPQSFDYPPSPVEEVVARSFSEIHSAIDLMKKEIEESGIPNKRIFGKAFKEILPRIINAYALSHSTSMIERRSAQKEWEPIMRFLESIKELPTACYLKQCIDMSLQEASAIPTSPNFLM